MVSVLDSKSGRPGLSPGQGKTLYSRGASLHPGV